MLNLSHSEEDLADRSSDLVKGKSQDFENKKIRRLGRKQALRPCAASFHRVDVNSDPPKNFSSASLTGVLSAWRAAPFGRASKSLWSGLPAGDVLYSTACPKQKRSRSELCHSTLHAHNVRPVRMYRSMSREIPRGPRCVVTRTCPSLKGRIFSLGQPFPPDVVPPSQ